MSKIRILIADQHELIRHGVRITLRSEQNAVVIGEAATWIEALNQAKKLKPDVVVMDLVMPGLDGIDAIRGIRISNPNTRTIILTMEDSEVTVRKALDTGVDGYVLKSDLAIRLKAALRVVSRGGRYLSPEVTEALANNRLQLAAHGEEESHVSLTNRELEVLRLLSLGKSSKEIGAALEIAVRTVETHRANLMRKANLHSVTELLHYAFANNLLEPKPELAF